MLCSDFANFFRIGTLQNTCKRLILFIRNGLHLQSDQFHLLVISSLVRSSPPEVFLGKGVLIIRSKIIAEHPYRSLISLSKPIFVFDFQYCKNVKEAHVS